VEILSASAKSLEAACTDFFLIFTNTVHKAVSQVSDVVNIPLLHIADATGAQLISDNLNTIGLPGKKSLCNRAFTKTGN
jgi:aspartate racemase